MTPRERVRRAIEFDTPDQIPMCTRIDRDNDYNSELADIIEQQFPSDFEIVHAADPEFVAPEPGMDEWGSVWETSGATFGEVKRSPLASWENYQQFREAAPDFSLDRRYDDARRRRDDYPDRYLLGGLGFMMMNLINLRGYEGFMLDLGLDEPRLKDLISLHYEGAHTMVDNYAKAGCDAVIVWEDWGLQDRLMISPALWTDVFSGPMKDLIDYVHNAGMKYILHSCGYIVELLDIWIDMGLDVIQQDQQVIMGTSQLGRDFRGRICFFNPSDIQHFPQSDSPPDVTRYCRQMAQDLSTDEGGFMYKAYSQPAAIGMKRKNLIAECQAFRNASTT
jgi:hypothetical protein